MISYGSTDFENFKRSNISRSEFSFYAEPLNTSGRRYLEVYEIAQLQIVMVSFVCPRSSFVEIGLPLDYFE
jgi:hypothetical protein